VYQTYAQALFVHAHTHTKATYDVHAVLVRTYAFAYDVHDILVYTYVIQTCYCVMSVYFPFLFKFF